VVAPDGGSLGGVRDAVVPLAFESADLSTSSGVPE
jgi:hypothetical protein